jgi:hypothetical protein
MCRQPPLNGSVGAAQEGACKDVQSNVQEFQVQPSTSISVALQNAINQQVLRNAMQNAIGQPALNVAMQNAIQQHMQSSSFDNSTRFQAPIASTAAQIDPANRSGQVTVRSGRGEHTTFELDRKPAASKLNWDTGGIPTASQIHEQSPPKILQPMACNNTAAQHQTNSDFQGSASAAFPLNPPAVQYQQTYFAACSFPDNANRRDDLLNAAEPFASSSQSRSSSNSLDPIHIALLSNPPADPLLEEFARQYLPYFDSSSSDTSEDKKKSPEAEGGG